jgi:nucleotide-binding universal stress UspA family protein
MPAVDDGAILETVGRRSREDSCMSYSTIMVQLDLDQSNEARLRTAGMLAGRFNARVIGIAAADIQPMYFAEGVPAQEVLDQDRARLKTEMAALEQSFRDLFKAHAAPVEWRSALDLPTDFTAREARAADLIVAGSRRERLDPMRQADPGDLVLRAGRPVLAVPPEAEGLNVKTMLVAWKDTREARRAVNDALPLLHQADEVVVVEIAEREADRPAAKARVDDVAAWLTRRGIATAAIATKALVGVPAQIEMVAKDEGAGLIVAGAYGHSRLREWVFGGVTRQLLTQSRHCALLSH